MSSCKFFEELPGLGDLKCSRPFTEKFTVGAIKNFERRGNLTFFILHPATLVPKVEAGESGCPSVLAVDTLLDAPQTSKQCY